MPTKKPNAETTLVTVAESIGSALGAVVAKANKARKALAPKTAARRHTKKGEEIPSPRRSEGFRKGRSEISAAMSGSTI